MPNRYAFITKEEGYFSLQIGRDIPGLASHGAATEVGRFLTQDDAKEHALRRGVKASAIQTETKPN
jgi:hypothetical protein